MGITRAQKIGHHEPRFDFGVGLDSDLDLTGTIQELLAELNHEAAFNSKGMLVDSSGRKLTFEALQPTLDFIAEVTGRRYRSETESLPIVALKTMKLLYTTNDGSDTHLFKRLRSPMAGGTPTMEFRTTGASSRNGRTFALARKLLDRLSMEISASRLRQIDNSLLTSSKLIDCIAIENQELVSPIIREFGWNDALLAMGYKHLAASVPDYNPGEPTCANPINEAVYTYLRKLAFLHFSAEFPSVLKRASITSSIKPIEDEVRWFCAQLSPGHGDSIAPDTRLMTMEGIEEFVANNSLALGKLIKSATGIHSEKRDLTGSDFVSHVTKLLHAYAFHESGGRPPKGFKASVSDVLAALCTVRYQQKTKPMTTYPVYWVGQRSSEKTERLLGHLDSSRGVEELYEDDYIPFGAMQLLYHRFCAFHSAISGHSSRHGAWMEFQTSRLAKYAECLLSNDIDQINVSVNEFNEYCQAQVELLLGRMRHLAASVVISHWLDGAHS